MIQVTDQIGISFSLPTPAKKIVSCVPSLTEMLFDIGLETEVAGRTKFCIHPNEKVKKVKQYGGTKTLNVKQIMDLKPDLIICAKEENEKSQIEILKKNFPVYTADIKTLDDNIAVINDIGFLTGHEDEATVLADKIKIEFEEVKLALQPHTCIYLIWNDPIMAAGGDSFINEMLRYAGFNNLMHDKMRYPVISEQNLAALQPEYILLSSEPYPFKEKHISYYSAISPASKVILVDGELFSWYGSRILNAPKYFKSLK